MFTLEVLSPLLEAPHWDYLGGSEVPFRGSDVPLRRSVNPIIGTIRLVRPEKLRA